MTFVLDWDDANNGGFTTVTSGEFSATYRVFVDDVPRSEDVLDSVAWDIGGDSISIDQATGSGLAAIDFENPVTNISFTIEDLGLYDSVYISATAAQGDAVVTFTPENPSEVDIGPRSIQGASSDGVTRPRDQDVEVSVEGEIVSLSFDFSLGDFPEGFGQPDTQEELDEYFEDFNEYPLGYTAFGEWIPPNGIFISNISFDLANTPPEANDDFVGAEAGSEVVVDALANDVDADGDALQIFSATTEANGSLFISPDGAAITYTPDTASTDPVFIDYEISDENGGSDTAQIFIDYAAPDDGIIRGTDGDDVLNGTPGDDEILGFGGDDQINGSFGDDVIEGGDGDDRINGRGDDDRIDGGAGDDEIIGGWGDDRITGGDGQDVLEGQSGNDQIDGGAENDLLFGGSGNDRLSGGDGDDEIDGGNGNDAMYGGDGDDVFFGGRGNDSMEGGLGFDFLFGGEGNDVINGRGDDDVMEGEAGNDTLIGGWGNDFLGGGQGDDSLFGQSGEDDLLGDEGNDTLDGGGGADFLDGGFGDDVINGGTGNDTIIGDAGDDTMTGGRGSDLFTVNEGDGVDVITDFELGKDQLDLAGVTFGTDLDPEERAAFLRENGMIEDNGDLFLDLGDGSSLRLVAIAEGQEDAEAEDFVDIFVG